jgi:hypothetical protein
MGSSSPASASTRPEIGAGLARQGVTHEGNPVVGVGRAGAPALDLVEVSRQVVGQVQLGGAPGGQKHVVQRRPASEADHRPLGGRAHLLDEVADGVALVLLQIAVVVAQVVARQPLFESVFRHR